MKPPSALVSIGGFGAVVALMSIATATALLLVVPAPPPESAAPLDALTALCCGGQGYVRAHGGEPGGPRVPWMEQLFAQEMGRDRRDLRVVWLDRRQRSPQAVRAPDRPAQLTWRARRDVLGRDQPAIVAAVRAQDGSWISVRPDPPWLNAWRVEVLALLASSLAVLVALALLLARYLTRPFRRLAEALDAGWETLPKGGPRELQDAVAAIADTRLRLETEIGDRRRVLTAVVHDIRTPLTALRLRVEDVGEPRRSRMVADIDRMQHMVDEVLAFSRATSSPRERLRVRGALAEAIAGMPARPDTLRLLPGPDAWVAVPPLSLRRAIENLLRNALEHASGGEIAVSLHAGCVAIHVRDQGQDLAAVAVDAVERRPFGSAAGTGLGLSIVQGFADQEGGRFAIGPDAAGGTVATLELPISEDENR